VRFQKIVGEDTVVYIRGVDVLTKISPMTWFRI